MGKDRKNVTPVEIADFMNGATLERYTTLVRRTEQGVAEQTQLARLIQGGVKKELVVALEALFETRPDLQESPQIDKIKAVAKPSHQHTPLLDACIEADVPAYLYGEAGSGKSTAAELAAGVRGMALRAISLSPMTSKSDLLGYRDAMGAYHDTGFRNVYEHGGVFLFDEMDNGNPSVIALVNRALSGWENEFPDRPVERNWNTRIVAAANTIGRGATAQYVGRNALDAATLDRFAMIPWDIDERLENQLLHIEPGSDVDPIDISEGGIPTTKEWLEEVRSFRSRAAATKLRAVISPRSSIYGSKLAEVGVGMRWLAEMLLYKGVSEADRRKLGAVATKREVNGTAPKGS